MTGSVLAALSPNAAPKQKAALVGAYEREVAALAQGGWLTPSPVQLVALPSLYLRDALAAQAHM